MHPEDLLKNALALYGDAVAYMYRPYTWVVSKVDKENVLAIVIALEVATRLNMKLNCHNIFLDNLRNNPSIVQISDFGCRRRRSAGISGGNQNARPVQPVLPSSILTHLVTSPPEPPGEME